MLVGHLVVGILAQPLAPLDVGVDRAALDRPRAHQRHLHGQVVEVLAAGCAAASASARGSRSGRRRWSPPRGSTRSPVVVERDAREVDPLLARCGRSPRRSARPRRASPARAGRSSGSRRRSQESLSHWTIWRPSIAAGTTGQTSISGRVEITIPPGCWEAWRGSPADLRRPARARPRQRGTAARSPAQRLDQSRSRPRSPPRGRRPPAPPCRSRRRQPERLAEVAHRALRPVGGEGCDQRRVLLAVALVDPRDQHLADVAGEVEVDVRHRGGLVVEEAAGEELGLHRVDVGEAGQVADDRADAGAPSASGREDGAGGRVGPADLERDLTGQLQHVAVEEEEAGEAEAADRRQLPLEPALGFGRRGSPG